MNYRESYEEGRRQLRQAGIDEADLDARLLLEYVCGTNRNDLLVHGQRLMEDEKMLQYDALIKERKKRVPLQHLTGSQNFMGLDFKVNDKVLIPRQDTEILVEEVLKYLHDGMRILDMCTGSGCILISLMQYSNDCQGDGADISQEALAVARENARKLLQEEKFKNIRFLQGDLFEAVQGRYDVIVSNPPYIATAVIDTLMPEVREHEPVGALDGMEDGLAFYRRIIGESSVYLMRGGMLFLEIGCDQAEDVVRMMLTSGYEQVQVVQDYAGLDRVVFGTLIG